MLYDCHSVVGIGLFPAKSHLRMKDSVTKTAHGGEDGESQSDRSPPPATAEGVDSCCGSWIKHVSLRVPADYRDEALQCLKLAVPVVRSNKNEWRSGY